MTNMTNKIFETILISNETTSLNGTNRALSNNSKYTEKYSHSNIDDIFQIKNLISKRTNRGRKEKITIQKDIPKCEVCLSYFAKEPLISCSICKCLFHRFCYNQYEEIISSNNENHFYRCIRCIHALKLNKSLYEFKCFICGHSNKVLKYNNFKGIYYHQICLDNLSELNDLKDDEISQGKIRRWRFKNSCKYCGHKLSNTVAVTKCKKPKCKEYYHIPCAIEKGLIFDQNFMKDFYQVQKNNQIPFYCSNHNKKISNLYKIYFINQINKENEIDQNTEIDEMKKTFPNETQILEDKEDKNHDNEDKESDKNSMDSINEDKFYEEEKVEDNYHESKPEERKENDENMDIDDIGENCDENISRFNLDNLLNIDFNNKNLNKNEYLESNIDNCDIGFNTKIHNFYKNGGLMLKKSYSFKLDFEN